MNPEAQLNCHGNVLAGRAAERAAASPRAAQPGAGGDPSVTPLDISTCSGGEDWLELSLYLQHTEFGHVQELLDAARNASESNLRGPDELEIAGRKFLMLPSAALAGTAKKQVVYRWRMRSEDGWWLLLMHREDVHETLPTGIARASSLPLMRIGPKAFLRQLRETLDDLGIQFQREKLSRVDPCVDLADVAIGPLYEAFMKGHYVSRARYSTDRISDESIAGYRFGRRPTGCEIGKSNSRGRLYDKLHRCMTDFEMLLLMQTRRWGGVVTKAIRFEFELRREKLKELGVDSVNDWFEKRGAIVEYLCHSWFRITATEFDPQHPERAATHPDWLKVQDGFRDWAGQAVGELFPLPRLPIRADHLLQQVIGALVSFHARVGTAVDNNETFVHESMAGLLDLMDERDMAEEVRRRAVELGAWR